MNLSISSSRDQINSRDFRFPWDRFDDITCIRAIQSNKFTNMKLIFCTMVCCNVVMNNILGRAVVNNHFHQDTEANLLV